MVLQEQRGCAGGGSPGENRVLAQKHPALACSPSSHLDLTFWPTASTLVRTPDRLRPSLLKASPLSSRQSTPLPGQARCATCCLLVVREEDFVFSLEVKTLDPTAGLFSGDRKDFSSLKHGKALYNLLLPFTF